MRERPIIMQGESVRAILAGSKSQTRRVATQFHANACRVAVARESGLWCSWEKCYADAPPTPLDYDIRCPYGSPGDRLWVKEAWAYFNGDEDIYQREPGAVSYREGYLPPTRYCMTYIPGGRWRPSIHMPRWASRLTLEITEVRVQRVQEISEDDALAEGIELDEYGMAVNPAVAGLKTRVSHTAVQAYRHAWDALNAKRGFPWSSNPWVWAVTFKRVEGSRA